MAKTKLTRPSGGAVELQKENRDRQSEIEKVSDYVGVESLESVEELESISSEQATVSREGEKEGGAAISGADPTQAQAQRVLDPLAKKIEGILEEGLEDVYKNLPPDKQLEFKNEGEEVAGAIRVMIETAKFSVRKVLKLIRDWLRIIPGVNRFFLEQEAKIKTDKISAAAEEEINGRVNQT